MLKHATKIIRESKLIPYIWGKHLSLPRDLAASIDTMLSEGWELVESEQSHTEEGQYAGYVLLRRERPAEPGELPD
ncbi:MAG: hypothetical protein H6672_00515 [Anaerolineaceae bacterium]|nr:hypothetical protein [Anaerolineaceae bacterium]